MTVKEMMIYVDVAIDNLEENGKNITREELIKELSFLVYHQNKKKIMLRKGYTEEKVF